jgi:hypothetical protein
MKTTMFIDICHSIARRNHYFQRTCNAAGVPGFSTIQKVSAVVRMLAYGGPADHLDEYIRMGESITLECVNKFTRTIVEEYDDIYLREPNAQDIARLLEVAEQRGYLVVSIACIRSGRSALMPYTTNIEVTTRNQPLFLRLLLAFITGFGMHSLEHLGLTMILMCFTDLQCLTN